MELKDIYDIANALNEKVMQGELDKKVFKDMEINVNVKPTILYGIDIEFYRQTHDGDTEGFKHSEEVEAVIDGVSFRIKSTAS